MPKTSLIFPAFRYKNRLVTDVQGGPKSGPQTHGQNSNLNRLKNFMRRFLGKFVVKWILIITPHLAYVATLLCETLKSAKQATTR